MADFAFDLEAYLGRIGYGGQRRPGLALLRALHWSHVNTIPFENFDIWLGRRIAIDLAAVSAKLVTARRGGYCFEQNRLFMAALDALGFKVRALAARVWWEHAGIGLPLHTHMLLEVACNGARYLADVGFGGLTPPQPLALDLGTELATTHETYRLAALGDETALEAKLPSGWTRLYSFADRTQPPQDFALGNWYVSTHPDSFFTQSMIAVRPVAGGRLIFQDGRSAHRQFGQAEIARRVGDAADLRALLAADFGLDLTEGEIATLWERLPKTG